MPATNNAGGPVEVVQPPWQYQVVPASSSNVALQSAKGGAVADYIENLICVVTNAATSQVQIKDGTGASITVLPNLVGGGIGTYVLKLQARSSSGLWSVTTGAGVSVIATGAFS